MEPEKRFIVSALLVAFIAVGAVSALNFWVDPFMQYRMPSYQPRFSSGFARQINAGLARNLSYDSVVLGSSYSMNFHNSDFDRAFSGQTISLAMPGMFASEGRRALDYAFTKQKIKRVFFGLDFFAFDESQNNYSFPEYLYDDSFLNDASYFASLDITKRSVNILLGRALDTFNVNQDMPWGWANEHTVFSRDRALSDYRRQLAVVEPPKLFKQMRISARELITHLATRHPDTQFEFFLPPYSTLTWILAKKKRRLVRLTRLSTISGRTDSGASKHPSS